MRKFSVIVATDREGGIGVDNRLPWRLPRDMAYFKHITIGQTENKQNAVIMGRKTWESIPSTFRPLPKRSNIILTRQPSSLNAPSALKATSLEEALSYATGDIFIMGGSNVYQQAIALPQCKQLYITKINTTFKCDAFFPAYASSFKCVSSVKETESNVSFQFETWTRLL